MNAAVPDLMLIRNKPAKSVLLIGTVIRIESQEPPPNLWWRFWYWALLGWSWKRPFQG